MLNMDWKRKTYNHSVHVVFWHLDHIQEGVVCWKRNALIHILQAILCLHSFVEEPAASVFSTEEVGSLKTLMPMYQTTGHGLPDG